MKDTTTSTDTRQANRPFPLSEAREMVRDLFAPNPLLYWLDFLFHVTLGWTAFVLTL